MMARGLSRPKRWAAAVAKMDEGAAKIGEGVERFNEGLDELRTLQEEYGEWKEGMSENLQGGRTGEMCDEITGLDLDDIDMPDGVDDKLSAATDAELPRGYGRD